MLSLYAGARFKGSVSKMVEKLQRIYTQWKILLETIRFEQVLITDNFICFCFNYYFFAYMDDTAFFYAQF